MEDDENINGFFERMRINIKKSISRTTSEFNQTTSSIGSDTNDETILKFGRKNTKYYQNTILKFHRKEIAPKRYNNPSLIPNKIAFVFDQNDLRQNPLNIKVINISKRNLITKYGEDIQTVKQWLALNPKEHVYIGKEMKGLVNGTLYSKWSCRFRCSKNITKAEMCCNYELFVRRNEDLWNDLSSLEGKILGCTCSSRYENHPMNFCHGLVLRYLIYAKKFNYDDGGKGLDNTEETTH